MTDATGQVTYSARYTPWGDTLESSGTGNFTFGYFGGLMDAATGLLYVGDGQYYDPSTGRFLTRNARPNQPNPYLPFDPTRAMLGPLGILAVFLGRRKKKSKWEVLLFILAFATVSGMTLSACNSNPPVGNFTATGIATPVAGGVVATGTATFSNGVTATGAVVVATPSAPFMPLAIPCPTPTLSTGDNYHPYGGNAIMIMYQKMLEYKEGWWFKHPDQNRYKFDFELFVGLLLDHEAAGYSVQQDLTATVVSQQLYVGGWEGAYCSIGQCSENAIANNLAVNHASVREQAELFQEGGNHISEYWGYGSRGHGQSNRAIENGRYIGKKALRPSVLNYDKDNALSVYGNDQSWVEEILAATQSGKVKLYEKQLYNDGYPNSIYYFTGRDGYAVYASVNQDRCWRQNLEDYCRLTPSPNFVNTGH